jgi:branched-chain amino acid transport system permease protein
MSVRPGGVYDVNYQQNMAVVRTGFHKTTAILFILFLYTLPLYLKSVYILSVLNTMGITLIAVYGVNFAQGYTGLIHLGQAAFVGVGAYSVGILTTRFGFPFWLCIPFAILISGCLGALLAAPSVRIKGFYLALVTIAAQTIIGFFFLQAKGLTGGESGMQVSPIKFFGFTINNDRSFYFITVTFVLIAGMVAFNLVRGRFGRVFVAVRDNDLAAEAAGVNLFRTKLAAFFVTCCYAGLAGSLWAYYVRSIHPNHFTMGESINYLAMILVGGQGSVMGPVFGVAFWTLLQEIVTNTAPKLSYYIPAIGGQASAALLLMTFGIMVIAFLVFEPKGINFFWERTKNYFRLWPFSH